jgi:pantoate--beta-alanine ligase
VTVNRAPGFAAGELNVYSTPRDVADVSSALRYTGRRVMLVPTMGALHDGHLALVRAAKRVPGSVVVVSIFVNPLQFGVGEDLDAYPRTLADDLALLAEEGVEISFTPTVAAMYPDGLRTAVHPGPLGTELEGAARPTHFAGMLTVVLKLLQIVRPDRVFFGEKDYQQLVLVRQMVTDLNIDVQVVGVPIVREADGLAMSSRNRYLDPVQREAAGALSAALLAGRHASPGGAGAALRAARAVLDEVPIDVDYLQVRDTALGPAHAKGAARLLVAARLGTTRLLDNIAIEIGSHAGTDGHRPAGSDGDRPATMRAVQRPGEEPGKSDLRPATMRAVRRVPPAYGGWPAEEPTSRTRETPWRN